MINTVLAVVAIVSLGVSVICCLICSILCQKYGKQTLRNLDKIVQGSPCNCTGKPKDEFQLALYSVTKNAIKTVVEQEREKRVPLEIKLILEECPKSSKVKDEPDNGLEVPEFMERPYGTDL